MLYDAVTCLALGEGGKRNGPVERACFSVLRLPFSTGALTPSDQRLGSGQDTNVWSSAILIVFRKRWGYLFNSDDEVVALVADVLPFIALFQITDGVAATAGSILRSLGLYNTGALINLTSYYIIGLPFGIWLTFTPRLKLGLVGLWIGLSVALGYASVVSAVLVWRSDWTRAVERVRERLGLGTRGEIGKDGKWEDDDEDGSGDGEAEEIGGDWRLLLEGVEEVEE